MFTLSTDDISWAGVSVSPSNALVVSGKDSETVYLNIKLNEEVEAGTYLINANIGSDYDSQQVTFTANVVEPKSSGSGWLEFIVIALIVIVIVLGLIVVFKSREEKEYY